MSRRYADVIQRLSIRRRCKPDHYDDEAEPSLHILQLPKVTAHNVLERDQSVKPFVAESIQALRCAHLGAGLAAPVATGLGPVGAGKAWKNVEVGFVGRLAWRGVG